MNTGKGNRRTAVYLEAYTGDFAEITGRLLYHAAQRFAETAATAVGQMGTSFASAATALQAWSPEGLTIPPIEDVE